MDRISQTKKLRAEYGRYNTDVQSEGTEALAWPTWLNQNGWRLDRDLLVSPLKQRLNKGDRGLP